MKPQEIMPRQKAGVIPFYVKDGVKRMLFMKPSDPAYGGTKFQIAKGGIEPGENAQETAIREGEEELGLIRSNIIKTTKMGSIKLTGLDETYTMIVYAVEIKDPTKFGKYHYETGATKWLTMEEFQAVGRLSHLQFVKLMG